MAGIVIGAPTLRLRGDYLAIVTLGFGEIIPQVFLNLDEYTNGARGITPLDPIGLGFLHTISGGRIPEVVNIFDLRPRYFIILVLLPAVRSTCRCGCATASWAAPGSRSARTSSRPARWASRCMRTKLWAYAVGAFFGGVGGVFYAVDQSAVFPTSFFFNISILILCMVILGGMGNVWGVLLGAGILAWLNYKGLAVIGTAFNSAAGTSINVPNKSFLIFGIILVVMMLLRPEGLLASGAPEGAAPRGDRRDDGHGRVMATDGDGTTATTCSRSRRCAVPSAAWSRSTTSTSRSPSAPSSR